MPVYCTKTTLQTNNRLLLTTMHRSLLQGVALGGRRNLSELRLHLYLRELDGSVSKSNYARTRTLIHNQEQKVEFAVLLYLLFFWHFRVSCLDCKATKYFIYNV